jgi:putative phosphoribosyl transferase
MEASAYFYMIAVCFGRIEPLKLFIDRVDAGKNLSSALASLKSTDAIILAIPRGGVVVGYEIARALGAPLDVIIPRKLGAPSNPELAIGAVAEDGTVILNGELVSYLGVTKEYIKAESAKQRVEIERRLKSYRGSAPYLNLKNRTVVVADDGIATGYTMKAALASVRRRGAKTVVMAVPVGPASTIAEMQKDADKIVCLHTPDPFYAIGQFYENFAQTTDEEVVKLLKISQQGSKL